MLPSEPYVTISRHTALTQNTSIAESIAVPKVQLFLILNAYVLAQTGLQEKAGGGPRETAESQESTVGTKDRKAIRRSRINS